MAPFGTLHTLSERTHPNTVKILAAAALNGLDLTIPPNYEHGKTNKTPEYLSKFPLGKIPSFETADGKFRLTESHAIACYVCSCGPRAAQLLGRTNEERALVQQWSLFAVEHLKPAANVLVGPVLGFMPRDDAKEAEGRREWEGWMDYLEGVLEAVGSGWLVPGREEGVDGLSLADLSVGQGVRMVFRFYLGREERGRWPGVMGWWDRLVSVPEVERAFGGKGLKE